MRKLAIGVWCLALGVTAAFAAETPKVVSFKDAAKIKSWDAWNDHKKAEAAKSVPNSRLEFDRVDLELPEALESPVWVDMITGRIFELPADRVVARDGGMTLKGVPMWDSPVLIAARAAVPFAATKEESGAKK